MKHLVLYELHRVSLKLSLANVCVCACERVALM